jgi:hypothetical protein
MWVVLALVVLSVAQIMYFTNGNGARSTTEPKPAETKSAAPPERWAFVDDGKNAMDDTPKAAIGVQADNEIEGVFQKYRPSLIIRCVQQKTEVIVNVGTSAEPELDHNGHTVRLKLDGGTIRKEEWSQSTNQEALFAPNPVVLLRSLAHSRNLRIEFTPFMRAPATIVFNLDGLSEALPKVSKACGWQL